MGNNNFIKKNKKIFFSTLLIFFVVLISMKNVFAHENDYINFGFVPSSNTYEKQITHYKAGKISELHEEAGKYGFIHTKNSKLFNVAKPFTSALTDSDWTYYKNYSDLVGNTNIKDENNNEPFKDYWDEKPTSWDESIENNEVLRTFGLSFPALHLAVQNDVIEGGFNKLIVERNYNDDDGNQAIKVSQNLIDSLNQCIEFINNNIQIETDDQARLYRYIAEQLANAADTEIRTTTFTLGNSTIIITPATATSGYANDAKFKQKLAECYYKEDIARVEIMTPTGIKSDYFPVSIYKGYVKPTSNGYGEGQRLSKANSHENELDELKITWRHVVLSAHIHFWVFEQLPSDSQSSDGYINNWLLDLLDNIIESIRTFFGLTQASNLIFGINREYSYYNNTMPKSWFQSSTLLFTISMVISWVLLFASIINLSLRKNMAALTNTIEKVDLLEGYRNIIISGILLFCIIPFYYGISLLSVNINDVFETISPGATSFGTLKSFSNVTYGTIFAEFFFLYYDFYMNFIYIYRSLILAILYGISPLCVITLSLGNKNSEIFINWLKALLSAILLANIHGLIVAIVGPIFLDSTVSTIEIIAICFALIPISKQIAKILKLDSFDGHSVGALAAAGASVIAASVIPKPSKKDNNSTSKKESENNNIGDNKVSGNSNNSKGSNIETYNTKNMKEQDENTQTNNITGKGNLDNEISVDKDTENKETKTIGNNQIEQNIDKNENESVNKLKTSIENDKAKNKVSNVGSTALKVAGKTLGYAKDAAMLGIGFNMLAAEQAMGIKGGVGASMVSYGKGGLGNKIGNDTKTRADKFKSSDNKTDDIKPSNVIDYTRNEKENGSFDDIEPDNVIGYENDDDLINDYELDTDYEFDENAYEKEMEKNKKNNVQENTIEDKVDNTVVERKNKDEMKNVEQGDTNIYNTEDEKLKAFVTEKRLRRLAVRQTFGNQMKNNEKNSINRNNSNNRDNGNNKK